MAVRELLERDHIEINRLYSEVLGHLTLGKREEALESLDLFWARLAVHIRAEHHHLFPAVSRLAEGRDNQIEDAGSQTELKAIIADLRRDHDRFMRELAKAVKELRSIQNDSDVSPLAIDDVRARVEAVGNGLTDHNRLEEERVYSLVEAFSSCSDVAELYQSVASELANLPPRFNTGH